MNLIWFLLRASWGVVLLAGLVGGLSGAASIGLVVAVLHTLRQPEASSLTLLGLYAALCAVVLATRIAAQGLLARLTQSTVSRLRMGLCRRILDSPLRHLEEIGAHRLLASLTGDVTMVTGALSGIPGLAVNIVILLCGAAYLGWLSPPLLLGGVVFAVLGFASYWSSASFARSYERRCRENQDVLLKQIRSMIEGVKEMKMHHRRRQVFLEQLLAPADAELRSNRYTADLLQNAAIAWGRLTFFVAIGLLLFAWPRLYPVDSLTLTGYTLTILYLMSPLEQILGWLPYMAMASASVAQIDRLGLMLEREEPEPTALQPVVDWQQIELCGVTHSYRRAGREDDFTLGPLELTLRAGEILFLVGGNGCGKTTLAKLLAGLYVPEEGEIRLDGEPITAQTREGYRQLFSVVFDEAVVFDSLLGLEARDLDGRAREYLRQLELERVVTIRDGDFSTTQLSRGQRKRLALLTAYLEDRPICLFDEWAADQDPAFKKVFYRRILPELKREGKTVIAITHDDRYFDAADRLVKLEDGRIVQQLEAQAEHELLADR